MNLGDSIQARAQTRSPAGEGGRDYGGHLQTKPKGTLAGVAGRWRAAERSAKNTVNRIWQEHNLKPHLSRTFKLSRDPKFVEKLTDVVESV